jgi:hypothetical protein
MAEVFEIAVELADDVASVITDTGVEFLNEFGGDFFESSTGLLTSFEDLAGGIDVFDYAQVGSFAGDADWFNLTSFGDIFGGPEALGDLGGAGFGGGFFDGITDFVGDLRDSVIGPELLGGPGSGSVIGSLINSVPGVSTITASLPSAITQQITGTAIKTATNLVSSQVAQIPVVGGALSGVTRSVAGAVNSAVNQQIGGRPITGPSLSSILGTPNIGIPNVPGIQLASLGNNIPLNLLKNPTGAVSVTGANGQPLSIQTPGFNPNAFSATAVNTAANPQVGGFFGEPPGTIQENPAEVPLSDLVTEPPLNSAPSASAIDQSAGPVGYTVSADPEGGFAVVSNETGLPVATGLTEQQALLQAQEQTFIDAGETPAAGTGATGPLATPPGGFTPEQLNAIAAAQGVDLGDIDFTQVGPQQTDAALFAAEAATTAALRDQARQQQTIRAQRQNQAQSTDWRVRLRLAPQSDYLYNAVDCGPVLWPLRDSDGVIFPYTPSIDIGYKANYETYDLTHSNYRGYFYKNSHIDSVNLKATFTAQDTTEANYLLAVIHFFRSVTKMFYGQDSQRGSPPPLTYLSGLGDYQFNEHPCVISQFNYSLPADVNYIRAQSVLANGTNLLNARKRQTVLGNPLSYALQRLSTVGMTKGGLDGPFAPGGSLGADNSTYVPTKMDIQLTLLPIQSRSQVSKQFSVKGFANGNLLKGGFW